MRPAVRDPAAAAGAAAAADASPSIRSRLANALAIWSVLWGLAVGSAVWLAAAHEVDELLDDSLQAAAELLAGLVSRGSVAALPARVPGGNVGEERFAWQLVRADGELLLRSARAPAHAWQATPQAGFSDHDEWRLYGVALADARMLYAAQARSERREARAEVALNAVLAALAVGLLGHAWLRTRVRDELQPLQALSDRLERWDANGGAAHGDWGSLRRRELQPVQRAIESLTSRLAARIADEQAFSAHAAHALRTPLAGIDAQLAVMLRDCPPAQRERLQRVRDGATRLQAVVAALLGLFRTGEPRREAVPLAELAARLPVSALQLQVAKDAHLHADPDLVAAALLNLLDNAQRHGACHVRLDMRGRNTLRLHDDGSGVDAPRREALQAALDSQRYEGTTGLGLLLADRVARAHGGRLRLPAVDAGFAVELDLG